MDNFSDVQIRILEKQKITCSDVIKLLDDYVDRELPPTLERRLRTHIRGCHYCQEMEGSYRFTIELASELKDEPVPEGVRHRLRGALNERLGLNL